MTEQGDPALLVTDGLALSKSDGEASAEAVLFSDAVSRGPSSVKAGDSVVLLTDSLAQGDGTVIVDGFDVEITQNNSPIAKGELGAVITTKNTGSAADTQDIRLLIDGTEVDRRENVSLDVGEETDVLLKWSVPSDQEAGDYQMEAKSDDDTDSVTVKVVDIPYEVYEDPEKGTVLEMVATVSAFDNEGGTSLASVRDLSDIDALYAKGQHGIFGTPLINDAIPNSNRHFWFTNSNGGSSVDDTSRSIARADMDDYDSGVKVGGDLVYGKKVYYDVSDFNDTLYIEADDGLADITG